MIFIEEREVDINRFPDGTLLLKEDIVLNYSGLDEITLTWLYDDNEELVSLIFLVKHIRDSGIKDINLKLPYIPNARQDRVKTDEDVFTLKYFADVINWLEFKSVEVLSISPVLSLTAPHHSPVHQSRCSMNTLSFCSNIPSTKNTSHTPQPVFAFQSFSLISKPCKDILPDEALTFYYSNVMISSSEPPSHLARNSLVTLHLLAHDPGKMVRGLI